MMRDGTYPTHSRSIYLSVLLGVAYGIALRLILGFELLADQVSVFEGIVSFSFLFLVPLVIGFITTLFAEPRRSRSLKWAIFGPWISILCFLATSVVLLLEGSICVVLALPGFLVLSSLGGLLAWWASRWRAPRTTTLCVALVAPLLASSIERVNPPGAYRDTVVSTIRIEAAPEVIWSKLTDVGLIDDQELSFGLTRLMGMPSPLEAHMQETTAGWVRNTRWAKGVEFRELITSSSPAEYLNWDFDFPPTAVPAGVLDDHVLIGGRYFELVSGGYRLERLADGATELTLHTSYLVSARPALYSRLWARVVLTDFHGIILRLMRDRSERHAA